VEEVEETVEERTIFLLESFASFVLIFLQGVEVSEVLL